MVSKQDGPSTRSLVTTVCADIIQVQIWACVASGYVNDLLDWSTEMAYKNLIRHCTWEGFIPSRWDVGENGEIEGEEE